MKLPAPRLKVLYFQFQKLGSREAVRQRVLEVVNHVDKVGCPRGADDEERVQLFRIGGAR